MPKQLVLKAMKSPGWLFAVCFALWFAAHSFFAFLFVSATVAVVDQEIHQGSVERGESRGFEGAQRAPLSLRLPPTPTSRPSNVSTRSPQWSFHLRQAPTTSRYA